MPCLEITERAARRRLGVGPDFLFFRYERLRDDLMSLTGCVPSGVYRSGKRKGRPKYDGPEQTAYVLNSEAAAEAEIYRAETGNCAECFGAGKRAWSASVKNGTTYKPCRECDGTGKAKTEGRSDGP